MKSERLEFNCIDCRLYEVKPSGLDQYLPASRAGSSFFVLIWDLACPQKVELRRSISNFDRSVHRKGCSHGRSKSECNRKSQSTSGGPSSQHCCGYPHIRHLDAACHPQWSGALARRNPSALERSQGDLAIWPVPNSDENTSRFSAPASRIGMEPASSRSPGRTTLDTISWTTGDGFFARRPPPPFFRHSSKIQGEMESPMEHSAPPLNFRSMKRSLPLAHFQTETGQALLETTLWTALLSLLCLGWARGFQTEWSNYQKTIERAEEAFSAESRNTAE